MGPGPAFAPSVQVGWAATDDSRRWDGLADGGTVHAPLSVKPWGDEFGALTDRFGVDWVMNISQPA